MGNHINCCQAEEQKKPDVKPFILTCEGESIKFLAPPDSLHSLQGTIKSKYELDSQCYELKGTVVQKISNDMDYMKEMMQQGVAEYKIEVIPIVQSFRENFKGFDSTAPQSLIQHSRRTSEVTHTLSFPSPMGKGVSKTSSIATNSARPIESLQSTFRATDLITFDLERAYRIDIAVQTAEPWEIQGSVTLSPDAAWIVFASQFVLFTGGGKNEDMKKAFVLMIDKQGNAFNAAHKNPMNCGRSFHGIVKYKNNIYVLGGLDEFGVPQSSFERYEISQNIWLDLKPLPRPAKHVTACEHNGILYYTDFNARVVFSYIVNEIRFERLGIMIPENTGKLLTVVKDTLHIIMSNKLVKLDTETKAQSEEVELNLACDLKPNTTCVYDQDAIYFINSCNCLRFSLSTNSITSIN